MAYLGHRQVKGDVDLVALVYRGHMCTGRKPESVPLGRIAQLILWVASTAGDEGGKGDAPGGLVAGVVTQIETPANLVTVVGIGAVNSLFVHEDHIAAKDR